LSSFPFKGSSYLFLAAVFIVIFGFIVLALGFVPTKETEEQSEFRMDEGGFSAWQFPDMDFDEEMKVTVDFASSPRNGDGVSIYVVSDDEYDRFMGWVEEGNATGAIKRIDELDFMYKKSCPANCSFDFTTEKDGDLYLLIIHDGDEEQEFRLTVEGSSRIEFGVCFGVFLLLLLIAGLVIRAALQMEDERTERFVRF